jgi:hypothetical protein
MTTVTSTHASQSSHSPIRRPARHPRIGAFPSRGLHLSAADPPPAAGVPGLVRMALRPPGPAAGD